MIMDEKQVRTAVEAAVRECDEYLGKDVLEAWDAMLNKIMSEVREHADDEYWRGYTDGQIAEREVHFK